MIWFDEVSAFKGLKDDATASGMEWGYWDDVQFTPAPAPAADEPQEAPKTGWKAIRQEKTAPVWTRRKKR